MLKLTLVVKLCGATIPHMCMHSTVADLGGEHRGLVPPPPPLLLLHHFIFLLTNLLPLRCNSWLGLNIVRCLKPNGLGTRPRSSIPLRVCTYCVRGRNLSKEEAHGGPGTCNPCTSGTCSAKREGATRAHPEK